MKDMETDEKLCVECGLMCCVGLWTAKISGFLDMEKRFSKSSYLLNSDSRISLTWRVYPLQCAHNDFEMREGESPGYFITSLCE